MFNLEQAIAQWRRRMVGGGLKLPEILDELESHLRDEIEEQIRAGLGVEQAFETAVRQIGSVGVLKPEFGKVKGGHARLRATLKVAGWVVVAGLIVPASRALGAVAHAGAGLLLISAIVCVALSVLRWRRMGQFQKGLGNLSPSGQETLQFAREEAPRLHHKFVGTEHVLLGLTRIETGPVANVMKRLGLNREVIQREVEQWVGGFPAQQPKTNIPYTPRVKRAIRLATKEARMLNHDRVGGEAIFLGLLLEGDGIAARVLNKLGVKVEETRAAIRKESALYGHQN